MLTLSIFTEYFTDLQINSRKRKKRKINCVVDARGPPYVRTKKPKSTQQRKGGPLQKKIDANSYIQSPQTDFQKGAQAASEDVITTQRDDSEFDETRDRDFYENK